MTRKNVHVVPRGKQWAVITAGSERAVKVHNTQKSATVHAQTIAKNNGTDTKIHNAKGQIVRGNSYGPDPHPPKDRK